MSVIEAIFLGVIQGITSVLPVSGSGHLLLAGRLMGTQDAMSMYFLAAVHMGSLLAVLLVWRKDVSRMFSAAADILWDLLFNISVWIRQIRHPGRLSYRRLIYGRYRRRTAFLVTATGCTFVVGMILRRPAEASVHSLLYTAMGFFVSALILLVSSYIAVPRKKRVFSAQDAVITGVLQGFAVIPGISRMGMVMAAAEFQGLPSGFGVYIGFLLSVPTVFGGLIVEIMAGTAAGGTAAGLGVIIAAILASMVTSALLMRRLARFLAASGKRGFAVWCFAAGILSLVLYLL